MSASIHTQVDANSILYIRVYKSYMEVVASLDLAATLTTLSPVRLIFSVSWSTAMLLGAHTNTCIE